MTEVELHKRIRDLMKKREEAYVSSLSVEPQGMIDYDYLGDLVIKVLEEMKADFPNEATMIEVEGRVYTDVFFYTKDNVDKWFVKWLGEKKEATV